MKKILFLSLLLSPRLLFAFDLASKVQALTLSNGMQWFVVYRPKLPVFSGIVMLKVGGADEEEGKTGLAHMFEHMAFKGSKDIAANEVWETLTRKGAVDLNAFTSKDVTAYHASMPLSQFPLWAYMTSEMVFYPAMREFYQERDVVMEERRLRYDNSPQGYMMEALLKEAFSSGPYHQPPIGEPKDLQGLTVEDAFEFHQRYYVPENTVGVLVGAVSAAQAKTKLEKFFGRVPSKKAPAKKNPFAFGEKKEKKKKISFPAEPYLLLAFHKLNAPKREDYVFDILNTLLCEGRTSRFYQKLVEEKKLASSVYCSSSFPGSRYENIFVIFASPNKGTSLDKLEAALIEELEAIKQKVKEEELKKVLASVLYDYYWSLEDNLHLAEQIAVSQAVLGDWRYIVTYPKILESITAEEIKQVASRYFKPENSVVVYRVRGARL